MNSPISRSTSSALTIIAVLIYFGHLYGTFSSIVPNNWYVPTDLLDWALRSAISAFIALSFLVFLFLPPFPHPFGLLAIVGVICLIRFRPDKYAYRQTLLVLPLISTFFCPMWSAYVGKYRPPSPVFAAFHNTWEMHVLEALNWEATFLIAIAAFLVVAHWKEQRIFALSILFLEYVILLVQFTSASWVVANIWL